MFEGELAELKRCHLARRLVSRDTPQGPEIRIQGRRYLNFSSNDYLGLANHPEVVRAAAEAAQRYGFGAGASRLLCGGTGLHLRLEKRIAAFKSTEAALVFNSGHAANTGIIPALAASGATIFSDELNHASIIDGCRLSRAKTVVYPHRDVGRLSSLLAGEKGLRLVVTDSIFSMDGDIAPLGEIQDLCDRQGALLYVDDAHATGVLGRGRGGLAHFGIGPGPRTLQMGTFSKALGSFGAFAAGGEDVITWLLNTARSFIFSTALPAPVIAASLKAVSLVSRHTSLVRRLWENRLMLAEGLADMGIDVSASETPIIPLRTQSVREALRMSSFLGEAGIYAPAIRPPAVRQPRVRITVSAAHEERHIKRLLSVLRRYGKR